MRVAGIRLFVRDLEGASTFFGDVLGLRRTAGQPDHGYLVFDGGGGLNLVVESVKPEAPADEQVLVGRFSGVSFEVTDMTAEHTRLRAAGVPFDGAPEVQAWGGRLATFRDPAGNQLQLVQFPGGPGQ
jgi:catechol 2,3-dioxygenase-like lactoylglutathione lyase family enzyme